jgi:hypothetical protein
VAKASTKVVADLFMLMDRWGRWVSRLLVSLRAIIFMVLRLRGWEYDVYVLFGLILRTY